MKTDLTLLCELISVSGKALNIFTAEDIKDTFSLVYFRSPESSAVGQAFRICSKNKIIVKVSPVQSKGEGRNGSLVWSWRGK